MRGWVEVVDSGRARPEVRIAVEFPQMFTAPAHHRTFVLDEEQLAQLLANERNGTFEFTIDDELS